LHVHVWFSASLWNPEPGTGAALVRARWEVTGDLVRRNTLPWGVWENREDDQVLHADLRNVRVVGNGPCGATGPSLTPRVHGSIVLDAPFSHVSSIPIFGVVVTVGPRARKLAVVRECGLSTVVGELNGELASSRELKELASWRWDSVTATISLEPPLVSAQVEEWADDGVCVLVILTRVGSPSAVHSVGESGSVSISNTAQRQKKQTRPEVSW